MSAHTPGPWETVGSLVRDARTADGGGFIVADCGGLVTFRNEEECIANARVVAAAPDLLDALRREQEWQERDAAGELDPEWDYETMVAAYRRAAIALAEGRS